MASSQSTEPVLPREIWQAVFSNFRKHQDLVHLWTDCRHVCRQFRDDVERVFSIKHLPKTSITFDCGWSVSILKGRNPAEVDLGIWYNEDAFGGKVNLRSIEFGFDRLENDGEVAVFKNKDSAEEFMSEIMQRVWYCINGSTIERPEHLVCFRRAVNDTDIPGVAVDKEQREIRLDWRAMYSEFFAEDKLTSYYFEQNLSASDGGVAAIKDQKLKDRLERGEADVFEAMQAFMAISARMEVKSRKSARRARIRRQLEADGQACIFDEEFEEEEKTALASLKDARFCAGFMDFSDDEEGGVSDSRSDKGTGDQDEDEVEEDNTDEDGGVGFEDDEDELEEDIDEDAEEEQDEDAENEEGASVSSHSKN